MISPRAKLRALLTIPCRSRSTRLLLSILHATTVTSDLLAIAPMTVDESTNTQIPYWNLTQVSAGVSQYIFVQASSFDGEKAKHASMLCTRSRLCVRLVGNSKNSCIWLQSKLAKPLQFLFIPVIVRHEREFTSFDFEHYRHLWESQHRGLSACFTP